MKIIKILKSALVYKIITNSIKWITGKTKWQWDDKLCQTIQNIVTGSPELIQDAEKILRWGKNGYKDLKDEYKKSKSKTETTKLLFNIIDNSPAQEIKQIVKVAKNELKK